MSYPRILSAIRTARWALLPGTMQAIRDSLSAHAAGKLSATPAPVRAGGDYYDGKPPPPFVMVAPGIASVAMHGIIGKKLGSFEMLCGGCDIEVVQQNLVEALASPGVATVILHIDSPGGTVGGVAEFANKIVKLRAESGKKVYGFIDGQGCSAAYWIACACDGLSCTSSSDVGSIGVYMALIDESENWAAEGYKLVLIKAGKHKAAGIAGSKITEEQIAFWQEDVDTIFAAFTAFVSSNRPDVKSETMQGQVFYGTRAQTLGLVDLIAEDMEEMISQVSAPAE